MVQIIRNTNPKHFEKILTDLQHKGWRMEGKIRISKIRNKQSFEAKMIKISKAERIPKMEGNR